MCTMRPRDTLSTSTHIPFSPLTGHDTVCSHYLSLPIGGSCCSQGISSSMEGYGKVSAKSSREGPLQHHENMSQTGCMVPHIILLPEYYMGFLTIYSSLPTEASLPPFPTPCRAMAALSHSLAGLGRLARGLEAVGALLGEAATERRVLRHQVRRTAAATRVKPDRVHT